MKCCKKNCRYNWRDTCLAEPDTICFDGFFESVFNREPVETENPKSYVRDFGEYDVRVTNFNGKEYVHAERFVNLLNNYHHLTEVIDSLKDEIEELETELSVKDDLLKMRHGKCAVGEDGDILTCICPDCYTEVVARLPEGYRLIRDTSEKGQGK